MKENRDSINKFKSEFKDADIIGIHKKYNYALGKGEKRSKLWYLLNKQNYCQRFNNALTILADGRVCMCCFDYEGMEIIGDTNRENILDIWNGKNIREKRELLRNRKFESLPLCSKCDFIQHNIISRQIIKSEAILRRLWLLDTVKEIWVRT